MVDAPLRTVAWVGRGDVFGVSIFNGWEPLAPFLFFASLNSKLSRLLPVFASCAAEMELFAMLRQSKTFSVSGTTAYRAARASGFNSGVTKGVLPLP